MSNVKRFFATLAASLLLAQSSLLPQEKAAPAAVSDSAVDARILQVKRICIGKFGEDALGTQVREMVIARLFEAKKFALLDTENCASQDFTIKGSITEQREQSFRSESEGISVGRHALGATGTQNSVTVGEGGASVSGHESLSSSQTKEHAVVTLRLVNKEGEILWAISMESTGGKIKGAIGDAAERAVRRFVRDLERAEKQRQSKAEKSSQR